MERRVLKLEVTTPIPDHHWDKLSKAIVAVAQIGVISEYIEALSIPYECEHIKMPCCGLTCEGCPHWEKRKVITV